MSKKILIIFLSALFFGIGQYIFVQTVTVEAEITEEVKNVGNRICPVSGNKIDEGTKVTYEYEGKIYNFCYASCIDEFKKDPEKYIKKVEEELQAREQTEEKMMPRHHMEKEKPHGHY